MPDVVINFNFGNGKTSVPEVRQRSLEVQPESTWYLIYEGLTPLDTLQRRAVGNGKPKGKQCNKGQVCGNSCISKAKTCRKKLGTWQQKEKAKKAKSLTQGRLGQLVDKNKYGNTIDGLNQSLQTANQSIKPSSEVKTHQEAIERGKAIADEFINPLTKEESVRLIELGAEQVERNKEYWDLDDFINYKIDKEGKSDEDEEVKRLKARQKEVKDAMDAARPEMSALREKEEKSFDYDGLIGKIRSMSGVDEATAKDMVDKINFDSSLKKTRTDNGKKYKHDTDELKGYVQEFMQIAGDKVSIDRVFQDMARDGKRAYAIGPIVGSFENAINVGTPARRYDPIKRTMFHEMAHHIEFARPEVADIAMSWVESRATSLTPTWMGSGYGRNEKAYPDDFISPYVGKKYPMKATEVISMGVQQLINRTMAKELYNEDKDHFYLTLGLIAG